MSVPAQAAGLSCAELPALFSALQQQHYMRPMLDDVLKQRAATQYIDGLDPLKTAFIQSEVEVQRGELPKAFPFFARGECKQLSGLLELAIRRAEADQQFAAKLLGDSYQIDEKAQLVVDPKKRGYAKSEQERQEWLKAFLHFQMANFLTSGMEMSAARKQLVHRYELRTKRLRERQQKGEEPGHFADAFAQGLDPHSSYMSADNLANFQIQMRLSLEGIGAALSAPDGFVVIESLVPGGAADKSGKLRVKDKILAVQQKGDVPVPAVDMDLDDVVKMIRGPKGSEVTLTILRESEQKTFTLTLVRDKIDVKSQAAKIDYQSRTVGDRSYTIGVIDLPSFYGGDGERSSYRDVKALVQQAKAKKVDGLVLDLTKNGGGLLDDAVKMAGLFIKKGAVVGTRDSSRRIQVLEDEDADTMWNGPLVVMTSPASASASEILAGALQDYKRAIIVGGAHTFGKGSVQTVMPLTPELGAIKVTIAMFFLPGGTSTQQRGVPADVQIPTLFDSADLNEASLDNALPPQTVAGFLSNDANDPAGGHWDPISPALTAGLAERSKARRDRDAGFAKLKTKIESLKSNGGLVKISELRKKPVEKKKDGKPEEEEDEIKGFEALLEKEAVDITVDAITFQRNRQFVQQTH